jgi:hypothetical protein
MFENAKIRCSALGNLMTEPKAASDKASGALSATAKTSLLEVYVKEIYGREKDIQTKPMKKGTLVEDDSITTLSMYDGKIYQKNEKRYENEFVIGTPDIVDSSFEDNDTATYGKVVDIKSSYDLWTFLANVDSKIDKGYWWQLQGYMWLTGLKMAELVYVLSNMPEEMILQEKYYLLKRMNVISEESPEYIKAAAELEKRLKFDDIPVSQRVIKLSFGADEAAFDFIESKVKAARIELERFHNLRFPK